MKQIQLRKDEEVFAKQLFQVRQDIKKLEMEDHTQEDRLLTIMRGRGIRRAVGKHFIVTRDAEPDREFVVVEKV